MSAAEQGTENARSQYHDRVDVLSGTSFKELTNLIAQYQADRVWNETGICSDKLEYFTTFVTDEILPYCLQEDVRFRFKDVIPTGSFREHSVVSQKTNYESYIEHEFDFMLSLNGFADSEDDVSLVDCIIDNVNQDAFKQISLTGRTLKTWKDCCVCIDDIEYLDANKVMECFEKVVRKVTKDMMERAESLVPGCIDISRNGPAVTLQFDIAKLPLEMQNPYSEDWHGVTLRKAGYNCINNWSLDLVLCVEARHAFSCYSAWISRPRRWPTLEVQSELLSMPVYLVAKSLDTRTSSWRLSTSRAELVLSDCIHKQNPVVRNCWLVLKAVLKAHLSSPKLITSYNLKTLIFYTMERISPEYWNKDNIPEIFLAILDALINGLGRRSLPHYFLPSVNLLSSTTSGDHLDSLLQKCLEVRAQPDMYLASTPNAETYLTDLL